MKGSDSVELKLTIPASDHRATINALGMDLLEAQIRQVFFLDTPDLQLYQHGVVPRARRVQGKGDDSVVKLRPVVPSELPNRCVARRASASRSTPCRAGTCARSMKAVLESTAVREAAWASVRCASCSRRSSAPSTQSTPDGIGLDDLSILGPIFVLKLKFTPKEFPQARRGDVALPRRLAGARALHEVHARRCLPGCGGEPPT